MKFRVLLQLTGILLSVSTEIFAQGFVENALLFSRTRPGGSARIQAMGGAQVALGGDFSSALSNPAGLGMYNRSEFTFSPALNFYTSNSEHFGTKENDSRNLLNIPGLSYVQNIPQSKSGVFGFSFGVSMMRINDFNSNMNYSGNDDYSSIIDYFIESVNGIIPDNLNYDLPDGLAYDSYIIDDQSAIGGPNDQYFSEIFLADNHKILNLQRIGSIKTKGAQYQWSLAFGGNYKDKLFFGSTIGITTLRYKFKSTYRESNFFFDLDPGFNPLDFLQLEETIDIEGSGVNLTLGVIYRPLDFVQLGASLVTPTYYQITDTYSARLKTKWNNYDYMDTGNILNSFDYASNEPLFAEYNLTTPLKFSLGAAFFISNYGFISGDVEFINYRKARYDSDIGGISFDPENDDIKFFYKNTINYRIGGELRYKALRFRAGYNLQSSPYDDRFDVNRSIKTISGGVGVRVKKFFGDVAFLTTRGNTTYSPYIFSDGTGPIVDIKNKVNSVVLTFGMTF